MPGPLFPVQNFVAVPYAGGVQGVNVSLLSRAGVTTNDGQTVTPQSQSRIVNCQIDFLSTTYKGQAAVINLQSQNNVNPLNRILMIYVDNELNSQNVTVAFPDTQQYIGVPAFTTGYYPVLTGQLNAVIYNGSTGKVPVTGNSQVSVIFCNFAIPGFLSQETLDITVNSSSGPVVPVIGDQVQQTSIYGFPSVSIEGILPPVNPPQVYYITGINITAQNLFTDGVSTIASTPPTPGTYALGICLSPVNTPGWGQSQLLRQVNVQMKAEYESSRFYSLLDETGLSIPVQGLDLLLLRIINATSFVNAVLPPWATITVNITYALVTL